VKNRPAVRHLFIFRHGETDWNREQRFQGHEDVPLNDVGREQARALIAPLRRMQLDAMLSSDLSRAKETGEIVARALGVPVFVDAGLREAHLGGAQGLTREEIERKLGSHAVERWKSPFVTDADFGYPGGETGRQVMERALAAMVKFFNEKEYHRIGVATHGGVIRRVMRHILGESSDPVPIPNGIVYPVQYDPANHLWKVEPFMNL
jgi:broad specificity phosphatase PhoE